MPISRMKIPVFTWPLVFECSKCGGPLEIYPRPEPRGMALCKTCHGEAYENLKALAARLAEGYPGFDR